jgi:hypothetical protein
MTGPRALFTDLDPTVPLLLLPVRLETRFLPDRNPTEIVVRIFPDDIHHDRHQEHLTRAEWEAATAFWSSMWRAAIDGIRVTAAQTWLAGLFGPWRAAYIARSTTPTNPQDAPSAPLPDDAALPNAPTLTDPGRRLHDRAGRARLLPRRWAAFVDVNNEPSGPFWSSVPVRADLAMSPALTDIPDGADARGFLDAQGLDWLSDLTAADNAGMVIRIPLAELPPVPDGGYQRLLVCGVGQSTADDLAFADLLEAHRAVDGLDLVRAGTPTNLTEDSVDTVPTLDLDELFAAELAAPGASNLPIESANDLSEMASALALETAFGLAVPGATARTTLADDEQAADAAAANRAMWPATFGRWFTDPMAFVGSDLGLLHGEPLSWLHDWFIRWVRPDGPFATIRIGKQPYGILPITPINLRDGPALNREILESFLADLRSSLEDAVADIAVLDPDATDTAPTGDPAEQASDLGAILGAVPHPREFRLRNVESSFTALSEAFVLRVDILQVMCSLCPQSDGSPYPVEDLPSNPAYALFTAAESRIRGTGATTLAAQETELVQLAIALFSLSGTAVQGAAYQACAIFINPNIDGTGDVDTTSDLVGATQRHRERVIGAQSYLWPLGVNDVLGSDAAPRLYTGAFDPDGSEIPADVVVTNDTDSELASEALRVLFEALLAGNDVYEASTAQPIAHHLLRWGAADVRDDQRPEFERGVRHLMNMLDEQTAPIALQRLEWLTRGLIGTATNRIDAWATSIATQRLASQRVDRPTGLQVGGYGWLVNVQPRVGRVSQGFIHAPTLDLAVTAAVLRAGWSAFGTSDAGSPLAVDLRSGRVRAARWILDGMRAGVDLGRLLGERMERRLRDANRSDLIDDVRRAVLDAIGRAGQPATAVADGLIVARARLDGVERTTEEAAAATALDALVTANGSALARALDGTANDLDAVADALFTQALHGVLRDDDSIAAPAVTATGSGDTALPGLDALSPKRPGIVVSHLVMGMFPAVPQAGGRQAGWPGSRQSLFATAEPRVETWIAQLLGNPTNIWVTRTNSTAVTIGSLGIGALDAVYADDLAARIEQAGPVAPPAGANDIVLSPDELAALLGAFRDMLGRIRPLRDGDLIPPSEEATAMQVAWSTVDLSDRLARVLAMLPPNDPRREAVSTHVADHDAEWPDLDEQHRALLLVERLQIAVGRTLPILPLLDPGVPATLQTAFGPSPRNRLIEDEGIFWLMKSAPVHPDLDAVLDPLLLVEATTGRTTIALRGAELPGGDGRIWSGVARPPDRSHHRCWYNLTGLPPTGALAGFVVDSWTEVIPDPTVTTGIATHFDRPSAMAPQALLLAVVDPESGYNLDVVSGLVRQTLQLAQLRAVGPEVLPNVGQFLPAVYLDADAEVVP